MTPHKKNGQAPGVEIRRTRARDAARIANLSVQLGYPATEAQIKDRLRRLLRASKHVVFVAEKRGGGVIGWLHASVVNLLESETRAEINGLIVADGHRSMGAGAKLLDAAEQWARKNGCKRVNLRCNVIRDRAHGFYLRQGYDHYKTHKAFRKAL
jgi:GNAT superfamily N-acetyltransferase